MTATQNLPLFVIAERNAALRKVAENAGKPFMSQALSFVVRYLRDNGEQSGEAITDALWNVGIQAHDRRAMGPVFLALIKDNLIERCGDAVRVRGHGCRGGSIYRLTK
jgi:hypothetical protein